MSDLSRLPLDAPPGRVFRLKGSDGPPLAASNVAPALTVDRAKMAVEAVICTPLVDHQGDVVDPSGVDLSVHKLNPVVFYDHRGGKSPHILPIGKAEGPNGNYTVRLMDLPGRGPALVAKTYFAQSDRFASEVFGLVAEDILRGTSIGFAPGRAEKGLPNPVEVLERPAGRDARGSFHFRRSVLHEYSHTPAPTNPEALTIRVEKSNYQATCPELYRALEPLLVKSRGATVTVPRTVEKAEMDELMPPTDPTDPPVEPVGDPPPEEPTPDPVSDTPPEASEAYDGAQMVTDLAGRLRDVANKSLHDQTRKSFAKVADKLDGLAAELSSHAEAVEAKLAGSEPVESGGGSDGDEGPDEPEEPDEPPDVEKSADGLIVTKSGYKPRRYTFADLKRAKSSPAAPSSEESELLAAIAEYRRMVRESKRR